MKSLSEMEVVFVDDARELRLMVDDLEQQSSASDWHLSVDFEGIDLCRDGEICIGQFAGKNSRTVYIVDFVTMNPLEEEPRLTAMLSNASVLKLLFDPRNDADALGSLHGVHLRGVLCLQLADAAHRKSRGLRCRFVRGLAGATQDVQIDGLDRSEMELIKLRGKAMFSPDKGGSYEVFKERPLDASLRRYCAIDVYFFDEMKAALFDTLPPHWQSRVNVHSREREAAWTKPGYAPHSREKAMSPF